MGVSHLLELDGPSCVAFGEVSSIDMLPCGSGKRYRLFGCGDHLGTDLGEVAVDGCSSAGGILASRADGGDEGDHPNNMW